MYAFVCTGAVQDQLQHVSFLPPNPDVPGVAVRLGFADGDVAEGVAAYFQQWWVENVQAQATVSAHEDV